MSKSVSSLHNRASTVVIIPAAGASERMGTLLPKILLELAPEVPVIVQTIRSLISGGQFAEIIIALREAELEAITNLINAAGFTQKFNFVIGGSSRHESVYNALKSITDKPKLVLVHDAARPLIQTAAIDLTLSKAWEDGAAILASRAIDTIKAGSQFVEKTLDRRNIWLAQTPQVFLFETLLEAFRQAKVDGFIGTDEASLVERLNVKISVVESNCWNLKITTPEDLIIAKTLLSQFHHKSIET